MALDLKQIEAREKQIAEMIASLQKEADELAIARRVYVRFSGVPEATVAQGAPRPSGAPTTFQMVDWALLSAEKDGKESLSSRELVEAIRAKYWPGLTGGQIMPTVYGFVKNKRLVLSHGKFRRVKG